MSSHPTPTFGRLAAMLARDRRLKIEQLEPDAPLESIGIDSLGMVEVMWNVEEEFGIKVPQRTPALRTVADVVRYIDVLVAQQGGHAFAAQSATGSAARAT